MDNENAFAAPTTDDDTIVRLTADRIVGSTRQPPGLVETAVREELTKGRANARIQTFVPIFAERAARARLAS